MKSEERIGRSLELMKRRLTDLKEVTAVEKMTGKLTRELHKELQTATTFRTRDKQREGKIAVDLLAKILEKDKGFEIQAKQYAPRGGILLGDVQGKKHVYQVASETNIDRIPQAADRVSEGILKNLKHWAEEGYQRIHAAIVYFVVRSPHFDILVFELVFEKQ